MLILRICTIIAGCMPACMLGCERSTTDSKKTGDDTVFKSPLQNAIKRGMKPNGDLSSELSKLGEYALHSRGDAIAICKALQQFPSEHSDGEGYASNLYSLVALFQNVQSAESPAVEVLGEKGIPEIIWIFFQSEAFNTSRKSACQRPHCHNSLIDIAWSLNMSVPGAIAHQSALKEGEPLRP